MEKELTFKIAGEAGQGFKDKIPALPEGNGNFIGIPIEGIAKECGGRILYNIVAVAATLGLVGYELDPLEQYLQIFFQKKGEKVVWQNLQAAQRGYEAGRVYCRERDHCPGPATGLPTRTEQADLKFAIYSAHGEFPRLILAPGNPEQAFYLTAHAFNMADKYQIPVIILSDQYLSDCYFSLETPFNPLKVNIDRYLYSSEDLEKIEGDYKRHLFTQTGISPRAIPGQSNKLVMTDSDEHDEYGHIIEDMDTRNKQVEKRMRKWQMMEQDILPLNVYGPIKAKTLLICWGSTWGIVKETMEAFLEEGKDIAMLHLFQLWPFPIHQVKEVIKDRDILICIENKATGQLADLLKAETGMFIERKILQTSGRPFSLEYLSERIKEVL